MQGSIEIEAPTAANRLRDSTVKLADAGIDSPRLNAEVLLATSYGCSRAALLTRLQEPVAANVDLRFENLLARRLSREPLQYIVGSTELWSLDFDVTPDVLIPRPETERLIELALSLVRSERDRTRSRTICDVGTGSGCIAIALAHELPAAQVTALDVSASALRIAAANAMRNDVADRIRFVASDLFAAVDDQRFDIVVSNPPYVSTSELDSAQPELAYEPRAALDGGADGLDIIRRLLQAVPQYLASGGWALVEIGCDQADAVVAMTRGAGACAAEVWNDYAGLPRVLRAQW